MDGLVGNRQRIPGFQRLCEPVDPDAAPAPKPERKPAAKTPRPKRDKEKKNDGQGALF